MTVKMIASSNQQVFVNFSKSTKKQQQQENKINEFNEKKLS